MPLCSQKWIMPFLFCEAECACGKTGCSDAPPCGEPMGCQSCPSVFVTAFCTRKGPGDCRMGADPKNLQSNFLN